MTKRQALKAFVVAAIPWHLGWTSRPDQAGPYTIVLDDVSEFVLSRGGQQVSVPVDEILEAIKR